MRVLYIEDSTSDADLARRVLAQTAPDVELEVVTTLTEGLTRLTSTDKFDVLLTDLSLPDGSGLEALAGVREQRLPIAVVILTGSDDQDSAIAALKASADDYLIKRDDYLQRLPHILRSALEHFHNNAERNQRVLRVLYIEHNMFDIDLMHRHLAMHAPHMQLTAVTNVSEAFTLLPVDAIEQFTVFDVLLINYHMSSMNGLDIIKLLRNERKLDIPIVVVADQGSEIAVARALYLGVDDYLFKHEGYLYEITAILEKVQQQAELARERVRLKQTSLRLSHLLAASPTILYNLRVVEETFQSVWVSENIERLLGYTQKEALAEGWWSSHVHPDDLEATLARQSVLLAEGQLTHEYRFLHRNGQSVWIHDEIRLVRSTDGSPLEVVGAWLDISEHKRTELIRQAHQSALDLIVANQPLQVILKDIAQRLETISPDMLVSILLLDKLSGRLKHGEAPSLPSDYNAAIDQLMIGEGVGSCGTSAWRGEPVIVSDIDHHPFWQSYLELTRKANLHACWTIPFKDEADKVLGTFAIYHRTPREPAPADLTLINEFALITALAVQKVYAVESLKQAAAVFESTQEGIVITDMEPRIVAINRAYAEITGYNEEQVLGKNPRIIQSGRHDQFF
ncbi:response regulator, partial [Nitrosomonas supralitoralis]